MTWRPQWETQYCQSSFVGWSRHHDIMSWTAEVNSLSTPLRLIGQHEMMDGMQRRPARVEIETVLDRSCINNGVPHLLHNTCIM